MKSIHYFIVTPLNGERYVNTNDSGIIINTSIEDGHTTQRLGIVEVLPINYDGVINIGDIVVVHHNTFRTELNNKGVPVSNKRNIKDNLFYIEEELIYLRVRGEDVIANKNYCFVEKVYHFCDINKDQRVKEQYGKIVYPNQDMINKGLVAGVQVGFKKESEYVFNIFGQELYMMKDHRILIEE
jgi:hypothetical protein